MTNVLSRITVGLLSLIFASHALAYSFKLPFKTNGQSAVPPPALVLNHPDIEVRTTGAWGPSASAPEIRAGVSLRNKGMSSVTLTFSDGGVIVMQPNSAITLSEYSYEKNTSTDIFEVFVLSGASRFVTGLIGKNNNSKYKVHTSVATIGIRGTDFLLAWCPEGCYGSAAGGGSVEPGLYGKLLQGAIGVYEKRSSVEHVIGDLSGSHSFYIPSYSQGAGEYGEFEFVSPSVVYQLFGN